jgi:hypothetical protein
MRARNFIQYTWQDTKCQNVTDIEVFDKCVIRRTINEFCVQEKMSATISKLLPKLNDRINFKGSSTSLRNIVKELGFLWKKNRMVLIEKHDVRCMRVIVLHVRGHRGFIPNALVIFSCDYCDQILIFFLF